MLERRKFYRPLTNLLEIPEKANRVLNLILLAFVLIIFRSWHLAVIQYDEKLEESRKPQRRVIIEPSKRGTIRDRFNIPLAINKVQYQVAIQYSQLRQIPSVRWVSNKEGGRVKRFVRREYIKSLSELLGKELNLDPERIEDLIHSKGAFYYSIPYVIKEDISEKEYYRLRMLEKDWVGVLAQRMPRRYYPKGRVGGDIIGYLGAINRQEYEAIIQEIMTLEQYIAKSDTDSEEDLLPINGITNVDDARKRVKELKEHAYTINDYVGKTGIEGYFEKDLRGFHGKKSYYSDARGNFLREMTGSRDPMPGKRLLLTISSELQEYAEKLLAQNERMRELRVTGVDAIQQTLLALKHPWIKGGAIVALDPNTGEVLALASYPRYDPNDFIISGNPEISKRKHSNIARWFENENYLAEVWDRKRPLERERYDDEGQKFFDESLEMNWENYLDIILPKHSPVRGVLDRMKKVSFAFELQKTVEELLSLSGQSNIYWLFNSLYKEEPHKPYGVGFTIAVEASIKENLLKNHLTVQKAKRKVDRWLGELPYHYDKALVIDLCRLAVCDEDFDDTLIAAVGQQSLSFYHDVKGSYVSLLEMLQAMVKELYHEWHFKPWLKVNGKEFLKEKRAEETLQKKYPKPYIDYYDKAEQAMFQAFWEEYRWPLLLVFLTGVQNVHHHEELIPYNDHLMAWYQELKQGAHAAVEWRKSYDLLQRAIQGMSSDLAVKYFKTLRGFRDLTRPLLGRYRHLRKKQNRQLEKDLAAGFYPVHGYGYGRSQAYRQATTQGSIFKLVTSHEALIQRYRQMGKSQVTAEKLNPLEITDQIFRHGKDLCVAYAADGKPIPQLYKGGRLLKSHSRFLGKMDLIKALETSSNPYFSLLAGDILESPKDLARAAHDFSYGRRTGIELPAELPGKIPNDLESNRTGLYAMANGQHTLVVTPLQTSVMLSAIANGGKVLKPKIVKLMAGKQPWRDKEEPKKVEGLLSNGLIQRFPTEIKDQLFMPTIVRKILLEGMHRVAIKQYKDSLSSLSKMYRDYPEAISDMIELKNQLLGKTSTAESMEYLDLDFKYGTNMYNHVWFGGIAFEKDLVKNENETLVYCNKLGKPELVVIVYLRYGGWGKEAAPIGAQIVKKWREIKIANHLNIGL